MSKSKSRAQQLASLQEPHRKDFDPEEDAPAQESDDESASGDDNEGAETEHYVAVGKSKLRKGKEIPLGPEYAGKKISREQLLQDASDSENEEVDSEEEDDETTKYADPDDFEVEVDEDDEEIDSDEAFSEGDEEKFKKFSFCGSSKNGPTKVSKVKGPKGRPTAADFMTDSEDDEISGDEMEGVETDEEVLDADAEHDIKDDSDNSEEESGSEEIEMDEGELDVEVHHADNTDSDSAGENSDDNQSQEEQDSEDDDDDDDSKARRADLRKIMNEEQNTIATTISLAAKTDADKGTAVRQQRRTFDSLLGVRMVLQKGLIATNSLTALPEQEGDASDEPYQAAEVAALKLWNTLDSLRHQLIKSTTDSQAGQKRKRDVDSSTPSSKIWDRMQSLEVASIDQRQQTLEKWWTKVKGSTAPLTGKLNNNISSTTLTSVIQDQLAKSESVEKTKRPRSCAPVQEKAKLLQDPNIYDDTALYKTLLNQLVDQRKSDSAPNAASGLGAPATWVVKEAKMRKVVDTKASKGRKLRYTVHEKLQNFMAPEPRGSWEPEAIDRFFGSLLGQKMTLKEEDVVIAAEDDSDMEGFRLF